MTSVAHCKRQPFDVLIDRTTKWGNPFIIGKDGDRDEVIKKYREHLLSSPDLLDALDELEGNVLGCWCYPNACHGNILIEVIYLKKFVKRLEEMLDKPNKDRNDKIKIFGAYGELMVYYYLTRDLGRIVVFSGDPFDAKKDMTADVNPGKSVEVKTQVAWIHENCFSIKYDQLEKCQNVDELYIICLPHFEITDKLAGYIYKLENGWDYHEKYTSDDRRMLLIPRDQPAYIKQVYKLSDQAIKEMEEFNVGER